MTPQTYALAEIAARWNCSHSTVLALVRSGQLPAIDISTAPTRRSHYIVRGEDLQAFEALRTVRPVTAPAARRRRTKVRPSEVIEFIQ